MTRGGFYKSADALAVSIASDRAAAERHTAARRAVIAHNAAYEARVRDLLGRWVSELEPSLIIRDGWPIGLGLRGSGEVIIG